MLPFAYYLLKVTLVSGLLYCYYLGALRNKKFHQYNRFYLLLTVLLSLIIPLVKINFLNYGTQPPNIIKILSAINYPEVYVKTATVKQGFLSDYNLIALYAFLAISAAAFLVLIFQIIRISFIIRSNPKKVWNDVCFVFTKSLESPFSFFRYIFWNENMNIDSDEGNQMLQHELTHVKQHHSADKLFLNIVLAAGWANPFFWVIRKELNMLHEFIADQKAITGDDTHAFAAMLLNASYAQHSFVLTNSFFHSPIKRRLIMFTTSKKPRYSYLRRLMILPLLSFVIVFFSFKLKEEKSSKSLNNSAKAHSQLPMDKDLKEKIYKVIERWVGVEPCEGCLKTGVNVLEISNLDNATKVKTIFASDNYFDFGNNKLLISKLDELSKQLKVPFDVIVPIHFLSSEDKPNAPIREPSKELIKTAQEKINNASKQKLPYDPVFIIFYSDIQDKEITATKAEEYLNKNSDTIEAKFPGGNQAWKKYLETNLNANVPIKDKAPVGVYTVKLQFIVTENGEIKDVSAIKVADHCPSCAVEAVRVIKSGPKWEPMKIDGKNVASQPIQFISFLVEK